MLCITCGNTVPEVYKYDSWYAALPDGTTEEEIRARNYCASPSIWYADDDDDAVAFGELRNLRLIHDGGSASVAIRDGGARDPEAEREDAQEVAREVAQEESLGGVARYNRAMGWRL